MIRSAAILMAVSAIVGAEPAQAPTAVIDPAGVPMTLRMGTDGTFEVASLSKLFEPLPNSVTMNPAHLGPGPSSHPGAYLRDAMYRDPYDRAELIARPYVTGGDGWLASASTPTVEPALRDWRVRVGEVKIEMPAPAAPK